MSNKTLVLPMTLLVVAVIFSPIGASAFPNQQGNFLDLKKAVVDINDQVITDIIFKAQGKIPIHNPGINWGYGIVTIDTLGQTNVIATTSHPDIPIADSELQNGDPTNDITHNHYALLDEDAGGLCGSNPFISDLTFESPGKIFVKQNEAILKNLPESVTGGNFDPALVFEPGTDIQVAASFQLEYREDPNDSNNFAICVVDIRSLDPQERSSLIIGEHDFHDDNKKPYPHEKPHDNNGRYVYLYPEHNKYQQYDQKDRSYGNNYY
ncbi:MAG: hypothetical protein MRJ93_14760 [Nitrososphaeraceae archaeon]|nr:hypothetical protein [Nitrososphaeraceae archaeon]